MTDPIPRPLTELAICTSGKTNRVDHRLQCTVGQANIRESIVCNRVKENDMVNDLFAFLRSFTER